MKDKTSPRFHRTHLLWLGAVFLAISASAFGQTDSDPWLIYVNGEQGPINAATTREKLVRLYGAANVTEEEVSLGEGDTDTATVLFPKDPERRIEIIWQDEQNKRDPISATISGKASRWHAVHGISLGMVYGELARINGKALPISWGTDEGNVVTSWESGQLNKDLKDVSVWFDDNIPDKTTTKELSSVGGRTHEKRRVNQITWRFR